MRRVSCNNPSRVIYRKTTPLMSKFGKKQLTCPRGCKKLPVVAPNGKKMQPCAALYSFRLTKTCEYDVSSCEKAAPSGKRVIALHWKRRSACVSVRGIQKRYRYRMRLLHGARREYGPIYFVNAVISSVFVVMLYYRAFSTIIRPIVNTSTAVWGPAKTR